MILIVLGLDALLESLCLSSDCIRTHAKLLFSIFAGDVIFTTTEVLSFFEPLHTVNEYRIQGEAAALAAGDVDYACLIRLRYVF